MSQTGLIVSSRLEFGITWIYIFATYLKATVAAKICWRVSLLWWSPLKSFYLQVLVIIKGTITADAEFCDSFLDNFAGFLFILFFNICVAKVNDSAFKLCRQKGHAKWVLLLKFVCVDFVVVVASRFIIKCRQTENQVTHTPRLPTQTSLTLTYNLIFTNSFLNYYTCYLATFLARSQLQLTLVANCPSWCNWLVLLLASEFN